MSDLGQVRLVEEGQLQCAVADQVLDLGGAQRGDPVQARRARILALATEYWRAWCGRPCASAPGGTMPIDCPSSTGKGTAPKSRTMWCVWLWKPASVQLTLPATVAVVAFFGPNRLV